MAGGRGWGRGVTECGRWRSLSHRGWSGDAEDGNVHTQTQRMNTITTRELCMP